VYSHFNLHIPLKPWYFVMSSFQDICLFSPSCCYHFPLHFPEFSEETNNWMALMSHFRPAGWVVQSDVLCSIYTDWNFEIEFPEGFLTFYQAAICMSWSFYSWSEKSIITPNWKSLMPLSFFFQMNRTAAVTLEPKRKGNVISEEDEAIHLRLWTMFYLE